MRDEFDDMLDELAGKTAEVKALSEPVPTSKPTYVKKPWAGKSYAPKVGGVTDEARQASIERQNALTNATNFIASIKLKDYDDLLNVAKTIKSLAKELLTFHKEV